MFSKLKQFKDLRDKAKVLQEALSGVTVTGEAAWGKVKVDMDGSQQVKQVHIDDALLSPSEKTKLQDGLKDAVNDAVKKCQKQVMAKMQEMGMGMPGME